MSFGTALAIDVLQIRRRIDDLGDEIRREGHADVAVLLVTRLGGDDYSTVGGLRTVESRGRRALQHRDVVNIVGVDVARTVAVVDGIRRLAHARRGVEHRHAVDDEQRSVVAQVER